METYHAILKLLDDACRQERLTDYGDIKWQHGQSLRSITLRAERGDPSAWRSFSTLLQSDAHARSGFWSLLTELGIIWYSDYHDKMMDMYIEWKGVVGVDPNAKEEYWTEIRGEPERSHVTSFRSNRKYSKRRPC